MEVTGLEISRVGATREDTLLLDGTSDADAAAIRRFHESVASVCEEVVGPAAAEVDRNAAQPVASWRALWDVGALRMLIPARHGGLGLRAIPYIETVVTLARHCAATAMTVHMHSTACAFVAACGSDDQQAAMFPSTVEEFGIFGSWGSEPTSSFNVSPRFDTTLVPAGGGFVMNGQKHFCTMAGAASHAAVWCAELDAQGVGGRLEDTCIAFIPTDTRGLRISGDWDPIGMRGTVSPAVLFEDCPVPASAVLRGALQSGVAERLALGFGAVTLGSAAMALQATVEYCQKKTYVGQSGPIATDPSVQRHVGSAAAKYEAAYSTLLDVARQWDAAGANRAVLAALAKRTTNAAALQITSDCMQLVGGTSATKSLPLERAYRDVRTASLMPPNPDRMDAVLGADRLNLGSGMYGLDDSRPRSDR
jgi:alkylation response protein AidB-like acyl-CoA dehydrogenase